MPGRREQHYFRGISLHVIPLLDPLVHSATIMQADGQLNEKDLHENIK